MGVIEMGFWSWVLDDIDSHAAAKRNDGRTRAAAKPADFIERAAIEGLERRSGQRLHDGEAVEWTWLGTAKRAGGPK